MCKHPSIDYLGIKTKVFFLTNSYYGCAESDENFGYRFSENRTDLKIQKPKTRFPRFALQKTDFGVLGTVFHVVSFTVHLAA